MNSSISELTFKNMWNWLLLIGMTWLMIKHSWDYWKRGRELKSTKTINKALINRVDKLEDELEKTRGKE